MNSERQAILELINESIEDNKKGYASFDSLRLEWLRDKVSALIPQTQRDLAGAMARQIDLWLQFCEQGINDFVFGTLAQRIDSLSEGSWSNFFIALLGNTIWATSALVPAVSLTARIGVVGINMAGVLIASKPTVPHKSKETSNLEVISDQMRTYFEDMHKQLNDQSPMIAATLLDDHPRITPDQAVELFLKASFKPEMIAKGVQHPLIDTTAVRKQTQNEAKYALDLSNEVGKEREIVYVYTAPGVPRTKGKYREVAWIKKPVAPPGENYAPRLALVEVNYGNVYAIGAHMLDVEFVRWIDPERGDERVWTTSEREDRAIKTQEAVTGSIKNFDWNFVKGLDPVRWWTLWIVRNPLYNPHRSPLKIVIFIGGGEPPAHG